MAPYLYSQSSSYCSNSEDAAQHQLGDALGMGLGISQRQRRAPRAAEHHPFARPRPSRAAARCRRPDARWCWPRGWRAASSGRSRAGRTPGCCSARDRTGGDGRGCSPRRGRRGGRPTGLPLRIAAQLPIEAVAVADVEMARLVGLDLGIERAQLPRLNVHLEAHFLVDAADVATPFAVIFARAAARPGVMPLATTSRNGSRKPALIVAGRVEHRARGVRPATAMSITSRAKSCIVPPPGTGASSAEPGDVVAQLLALLDRPVLDPVPGGVERVVGVEQADPQRRQRADPAPAARRRRRASRGSSSAALRGRRSTDGR